MATSTATRERARSGSVFTVPTDARSVLDGVRAEREAAEAAEARLLQGACAWADLHPVDSIDDAATFRARGFGDTGVPVAGPGAPWVAEFSIAEFAAAIGVSTDAGRAVIGDSVELRHRLPGTWARVVAGDLLAWRARRVAGQTQTLSGEAAAWVDGQVAPFAHKVRPWQVDRLVAEAIARFMPEEVERQRRAAADGRCFDVDHEQVSFQGTSVVHGELDLADALDLDAAVAARAAQLKALGSAESLDVRRAIAAGELARADLALDLDPDPDPAAHPDTGSAGDGEAAGEERGAGPDRGGDRESSGGAADVDLASGRSHRRAGAGDRSTREVVLYVHLSDAALRGHGSDPVARVENTRTTLTATQVAEWCGIETARVIVKPVLDLAERTPAGSGTVPDRMAEQVALRDETCVFPGAPARPEAVTPTTWSPSRPAGRPRPATSAPCAGDTTD